MEKINDVVITAATRTAIGSFNGTLASFTAPQLGSEVIKNVVIQSALNPQNVDEVIMGNVLSAGIGQAPARQAAIFAGLPSSVPCMTINKVCGSGLKAVMLASQSIALGESKIVVAGGMESMSNVPYYLQRARFGYRLGHGQLLDGMIHDGLWDPYNDFHMGNAAELCSKECNIPREAQDEFAVLSYKRAIQAQEEDWFKDEILPLEVKTRKSSTIVEHDEEPQKVQFDKISTLRPAFIKDGTVTAANASKINDGAAAVVVMTGAEAEKRNIKPLAKIISYSTAAKDPEWFTTAPADAIQLLLNKTGLTDSDIDLYEINEAFAVMTLAVNNIVNIDVNKVNVAGGAVALGHPIGASGARILTTLIYNLKRLNKKRGIATLCIGGGEAVAVLIETV